MDLLQNVLNAGGGDAVRQLAQKFNLNEEQTTAAVTSLLPSIAGGMQSNIASAGGLQGLIAALGSGQHAKYADDPDAVNQPGTVAEGTGILKHVLGGEDAHQQVAEQASQQTGISSDLLRQMLPIVASLAMGAMSKHVASGNLQDAGPAEQSTGLMGMLGPLLSGGSSGSLAGGVLGMASKFFTKNS